MATDVKFQQQTVRTTQQVGGRGGGGGGRNESTAHKLGEALTGGDQQKGYLAVCNQA